MPAAPYQPPKNGAKIIIVGGGSFGLSTAHALSLKAKGYDIHVYDREKIPASDAASTDINKIVRMDYGDDLIYQQLACEALPIWRQWNEEVKAEGKPLVYNETGLLLFSRNGKFPDYERLSMQNIRGAGYGHAIEEFPTPESIVERFPQFSDAVANGFNIAYLNKYAGWCYSTGAVVHLYEKCLRNGVQFHQNGSHSTLKELIVENGGQVKGIRTVDGQEHFADLVILATGAWTAKLIDMEGTLTATGHAVVHFKPDAETCENYFTKDFPVWSGDISYLGYYGFPANHEGKVKVACHAAGYLNMCEDGKVSVPRTKVANPDDTLPHNSLIEYREFFGKFLPKLNELDIADSRVCWYSDSFDGDFIISPHPKYQNLIVATGDSGHGMKFIPIIGYKIAQVVEAVDNEYTRAWAWRSAGKGRLDSMRLLTKTDRQELGKGIARFAKPEELKANAIKAKL
ncbi:hypothetical protein K450DRAFT_244750 [Umbelopsis ramanniana AG]|uniref:FAD dependent oxidoreductase domain-containing protein n=1 Tax=Umbelopsis ramanniana AG TaxID=1314678 RepID=A0AAD5E8T4_UMBRA|nr:uncharacterized protein K450DRAFT_244750 [Umbelopsis ramanniana AG]KAI8578832.1 hypothetical protein K450DRAFT_244750 [Umbelopsis ramanniana AG]